MMRNMHSASPRQPGFTLVEMVFTLVISGIVLALAAAFIVRPMEGYRDLTRRALLVNNAESALRQMAREIRNALPNSVRITNSPGGNPGFALEVLPVIDAGMYRIKAGAGDGAGPINQLDVTKADDDFDIHKFFQHIPVPVPGAGTYISNTHRLVVNNKGTPDNTAYGPYPTDGNGVVITPLAATISYSATGTISTLPATAAHHIQMPLHRFRSDSQNRRLYVIETPVTYLCVSNSANPTAGTLTRYASYPIQSAQPNTAVALNALPGVTSALVSTQVSACTINSSFNDVKKYGIVTLNLTLSEATGGTVTLLHQVLVENGQ